jgi:hypothetical protein
VEDGDALSTETAWLQSSGIYGIARGTRKVAMSIPSDSAFFAQRAERCFAEAAQCEPSIAAIGLRELGYQYLILAKKLDASAVTSTDAGSVVGPGFVKRSCETRGTGDY